MYFYMPTLCVRGPYYSVLLVQEKTDGVNLSIRLRRPALKKFESCWRFLKGSDITKSSLL